MLYVLCAKLGLALAFRAQQVTAVWPPTGFAIAAMLRYGTRRSAIGVFLGALIANATSHEPFGVAFGIAAGNTAEAMLAVMLMRRYEFDAGLARMRDVLVLAGSIAVSAVVAATIGTTSLVIGHVQPLSAFAPLWWLWWTGDALGGMIVAPFLLVWTERRRRGDIVEGTIGLMLLAAVSAMSFVVMSHVQATEYVVFPFVIWAALRFGPLGTATATIVSNAIAIWGTHLGRGPFAGAGPEQGFVLLEIFMAVVVITGLLLGAITAQYRQAQQRKDEFLAMLGHELRNPLAPIVHAVELLGRRDPPVAEQAREIIRRQAAHLTRLVDDLLDVSRITRGAIQLDRRATRLDEVVHAAADVWRHLAAQKRQRLTIEITDRSIWLDVDPLRFTQIVANLLHNAIKFTPNEGTIVLSADVEESAAVIRVRDSGEGMDPDIVDEVFDLFVQGPPALDRPRGGLGLGLTLVRQLVELHGGTVEARSDGLGKGSEFTIRMPFIAAPERLEPPMKMPEREVPRIARRVLVVEDHTDTRQMLMLLIERDGHAVRGAADGVQAIAEARAFDPDFVLLDIGLPGMDGYAVARELRKMSDARLIALTGYGTLAHDALFDEHLLKPVEPRTLRELLR